MQSDQQLYIVDDLPLDDRVLVAYSQKSTCKSFHESGYGSEGTKKQLDKITINMTIELPLAFPFNSLH